MSKKFEIGDSAFYLKFMKEVIITRKFDSHYNVFTLDGNFVDLIAAENLVSDIPKFRVGDKVKVSGKDNPIFTINSIKYSRPNYYYWITKIDFTDEIPAHEYQLEKIEDKDHRHDLLLPLYKKDDKVKHIDGKQYTICKIVPTCNMVLYILIGDNNTRIIAFEDDISPITTVTAVTPTIVPKYEVGDKVIYNTIIHTIVMRFINCTEYLYDICLIDMYGEYVAHKNNISETELSPVLSKFKIGDKVKISRSQLLDTGIAESNSRVCPCDKTKYTVTYIKLINSEYLYNLEFSSGPYYHRASDVPESDIEFDKIIDSKYKEGDCVIYKGVVYIVNNINYHNDDYLYDLSTNCFYGKHNGVANINMSIKNVSENLLNKSAYYRPKFKVGDKVRYFKSVETYTITHIKIFESEFRYNLEINNFVCNYTNVSESNITLALATDKEKTDLEKDEKETEDKKEEKVVDKTVRDEKQEVKTTEIKEDASETDKDIDTLSDKDKDQTEQTDSIMPKYNKGDQLIYINEVYIVDWVYIHNKVCFYKISSVTSSKTVKHIPEYDLSPVSRLFKPGDKIKDKKTGKILTVIKNILKVTDSNNVIFDIEAELITLPTPKEFENIKKIETYDKRIESLQNDLNKLVKERKDLADLMQ